MVVDPAVSKRKFDREVRQLLQHREHFRRRGALVLQTDFPEVFVALGTPKAQNRFLPYGVVLDFSDYDTYPPSVRLVDPFTKERLAWPAIPYKFKRSSVIAPGGFSQVTDLLQHWTDDQVFVCLAGVREYHQSSAHTGDPWWSHRGREGTLYYLLDTLCKYGTEPIRGVSISMNVVLGELTGELPK
jgi:hypothetical protein